MKATKGVSFEHIVEAIKNDKIITIIRHPNKKKYPNQKILLIEIQNYIYLVPGIETKNIVYLKTIFPSKKFTKKYIEERSK